VRNLILSILVSGMWASAARAVDKGASDGVRIYAGYISKVTCDGKLLVSSVGNDLLVRLEALPSALGCGVLLKPLQSSGRTNLVLETSAGSIQTTLEVRSGMPTGRDLKVRLQGDHT
jgi:hypothetical protein